MAAYKPVGAGDEANRDKVDMSPEDRAALSAAGAAWNSASTQAEKDKAHADAEAIRAKYGYSGGDDGSEHIEISQDIISRPSGGSYDLSEYLKQASAAQIEAELAGLKDAYEKSAAGYDARLEKLPQTYAAARNHTAAQDAIARKSFDERAAASGLNSGTAGQVELARSSAYQRDIADIDQQQANAVSEIELAKADLRREYENAIAQAKATGSAELANALYQELIRVQGLEREDAQLAEAKEAALADLMADGGTTATSKDEAAKPPKPTGDPTPRSTGYDNGGLSDKQVKTLQAAYGLEQDGKWGPNSQKVSGLSADAAWSKYLAEKYSGKQNLGAQQDTSAFWSSASRGYAEVMADLELLAEENNDAETLVQVIEAARSGGYINQIEEQKLKAAYGLA